MPQLFLEFFSEEMPARMQGRARMDLAQALDIGLKERGLSCRSIATYTSPCRLVGVVEGVPLLQEEVHEEKRGPRADAPEAAIQGFLSSVSLVREACEERETPKGRFLFATVTKAQQKTEDSLSSLVEVILKTFPWSKAMRWGQEGQTWVRPLHRILCLFNGAPVDLNLKIPSVTTTCGHRFMSPQPIYVEHFEAYKKALMGASVLIDQDVRRQKIEDLLNQAAQHHLLKLRHNKNLLDEVTGLVEWPHVIFGNIDPQFMALPEKILTTVMEHHQRYFSLSDEQGQLAPYFLTVANITPNDGGEAIVKGNEWVLRARLNDAAFFWEEDQKKRLDNHGQALDRMIFHADLGTIGQKVKRMAQWSHRLSGLLQLPVDKNHVEEATRLAKADLTTQLVKELPELQGYVGYCLALLEGRAEVVANAIRDHYAPAGPDQAAPQLPVSIITALADKLDTLVGFFLIQEKPTGSKDPFALRRACLGVIRIVLENKLIHFDLNNILQLTDVEGIYALNTPRSLDISSQPLDDLKAFFKERLRFYFKDLVSGVEIRHDVVEACLLHGHQPVRCHHFVVALQALVQDERTGERSIASLLTAYKRVHNILKQKQDSIADVVNLQLFEAPEEGTLYESFQKSQPSIEACMTQSCPSLSEIMDTLLQMRTPLEDFFEAVTVNAVDIQVRANRYALLNNVRCLFESVLDFSLLEGQS